MIGHEHMKSGVSCDHGESFRREGWIEWHVGCAGFENTQQPGDHVCGAFYTDAYQHAWSCAGFLQSARQFVGAPVQFAIAKFFICGP